MPGGLPIVIAVHCLTEPLQLPGELLVGDASRVGHVIEQVPAHSDSPTRLSLREKCANCNDSDRKSMRVHAGSRAPPFEGCRSGFRGRNADLGNCCRSTSGGLVLQE